MSNKGFEHNNSTNGNTFDLNELMKDDVIDEPNPINQTQIPENSLTDMLHQIRNMSTFEKNSLLENFKNQMNVNPDEKEYREMSQENYTKLRIKQKIRERKIQQMNKMQEQEANISIQDNTSAPIPSDTSAPIPSDTSNTDNSVITVSAKTLRNRRKKQQRKLRKQNKANNCETETNSEDTETNSEDTETNSETIG